MIEITVSATAGNATFELYTPSGAQMADDVQTFRGRLPSGGNYAIDVGSTGGLANYTLDVRITGQPAAPTAAPANGHSRAASGCCQGSGIGDRHGRPRRLARVVVQGHRRPDDDRACHRRWQLDVQRVRTRR